MKAQGGGTKDSTDWHPCFYTVPVNDVAGSATLALGTMLALLHRARTGEGQYVTTSLAAMSVLLQTEALTRYAGKPAAPVGSRDHTGPSPLERFYQCLRRLVPDRRPGCIGRQRCASSASPAPDESFDRRLGERSQTRRCARCNSSQLGSPAAPARTAADYADDAHLRDARDPARRPTSGPRRVHRRPTRALRPDDAVRHRSSRRASASTRARCSPNWATPRRTSTASSPAGRAIAL